MIDDTKCGRIKAFYILYIAFHFCKHRKENHLPHTGKVPDQSAVLPSFSHFTMYDVVFKWYPKLQVYVNEVLTGDDASFGEITPLPIGGGDMHLFDSIKKSILCQQHS